MTLPLHAAEQSASGCLTPLDGFGPNPGALRMLYYVPAGLSDGAPLVVALHGGNQSATDYAVGAGWINLADRFGFALLCPEQNRRITPCYASIGSSRATRGGTMANRLPSFRWSSA